MFLDQSGYLYEVFLDHSGSPIKCICWTGRAGMSFYGSIRDDPGQELHLRIGQSESFMDQSGVLRVRFCSA